ncbi:FecR domain-containing protein [Niabella pedocola]|uniref:FecR domain-containing protein n=1 Tax=Niabella pedocola TaxID=1752077 RepID=A0ABS8PP37_9BACT|nr:FecR family protein [Niabella pedocola]MCD2422635.1 FecR domain-containing protein [Niabella pedocola]
MVNQEELIKIIQRIEQGNASVEDLRVYNAWCNQQQEDEADTADLPAKEQQMFREINRRIDRKIPPLKSWLRIAAAAVVFAACLTGVIRWMHPSRKQGPEIVAAPHPDIAPGTNMATLVLVDGRRILLSEAGNGKLADQKGTVITKTTDSTLVYQLAVSAPANHPAAAGGAFNTLITARAQQYGIILPDGSKVWLNAATSLKFPVNFNGLKERRVELEGEAYFEVAKDARKPFIVHSGRQDIKVLGTHFNVSSYKDEPEARTTLLEGSVKINGRQTLKPGEQAKVDRRGVVAISKVNADASVAWKNGYFEFNDENVYEIMTKVARWYDVQVIYEGDMPLDKMKGAMSRFQNVSGVLGIMEATGLFSFRIDGKKIYVTRT